MSRKDRIEQLFKDNPMLESIYEHVQEGLGFTAEILDSEQSLLIHDGNRQFKVTVTDTANQPRTGIPAGWTLIDKKLIEQRTQLYVILCHRDHGNPEQEMCWVTWAHNADPKITKQYESTCTTGHYFGDGLRAIQDFEKRTH